MKRFKGDYIVYLITSVLLIALGIIMLVNDYEIGNKIINIAICFILVAYLALVIFPLIKHKRGAIQILTIVEFVLISLIAIGLVLQQFKVFNIVGACKIIGLVLWIRAVVELFRAYFYRGKDSSYNYAIWYFCLIIGLITLGTYMFAKPFFTDEQVILTLSIICFAISLALIIVGIIFIPKKGKKKSKK